METKTTIMIAEDHKLILGGLIRILNEREDFEVIGEAVNGRELLELLKTKQPHIILLDLEMPVMSGGEAYEEIKILYPEIKTIIISTHYTDSYISEYFLKGVNGYLPKNSDPEQLFEAIDAVIADQYYFNQGVSKLLLSKMIEDYKQKKNTQKTELTETELSILKMLCEEKTSKKIAEELNLTPYVVDHQRRSIQSKTQQNTTVGLVKFAIKNGIIRID
jgi:DNA-binding NarL/FixJ family response regulator